MGDPEPLGSLENFSDKSDPDVSYEMDDVLPQSTNVASVDEVKEEDTPDEIEVMLGEMTEELDRIISGKESHPAESEVTNENEESVSPNGCPSTKRISHETAEMAISSALRTVDTVVNAISKSESVSESRAAVSTDSSTVQTKSSWMSWVSSKLETSKSALSRLTQQHSADIEANKKSPRIPYDQLRQEQKSNEVSVAAGHALQMPFLLPSNHILTFHIQVQSHDCGIQCKLRYQGEDGIVESDVFSWTTVKADDMVSDVVPAVDYQRHFVLVVDNTYSAFRGKNVCYNIDIFLPTTPEE